MENQINSHSIHEVIINTQNKFNIIHFNENNIMKYEEYYTYNPIDKLYSCNICKKINPTKRKYVIQRHLEEQHFFKKTVCKYCNEEILRLNVHLKSCKNYKFEKPNIENEGKLIEKLKGKYNINKYNDSENFIENSLIIKKSLFKEVDKIKIGKNLFIYKNKSIGNGATGYVFIGGCENNKDILAIKVIKAESNYDFNDVLKEKNILVSSRNQGNFPIMIDWDYDDKYLYIAETLMGPSLKDLIKIYNSNSDILTCLNIGIDLFTQIEILHNLNILHGDIKAGNICYGNLSLEGKRNFRTMGFIDFSNANYFKNKNKINPLKFSDECLCTREYASEDVLRGHTNSRKDDLESIIYVIIKAFSKKLPWYKINEIITGEFKNNETKDNKKILFDKKMAKEKLNLFNSII